jgi:hypothetical protein
MIKMVDDVKLIFNVKPKNKDAKTNGSPSSSPTKLLLLLLHDVFW